MHVPQYNNSHRPQPGHTDLHSKCHSTTTATDQTRPHRLDLHSKCHSTTTATDPNPATETSTASAGYLCYTVSLRQRTFSRID